MAALNVAAVATLAALAKGLLAREPAAAPTAATGSTETTAAPQPDNPSTLRPATCLAATGRESVGIYG